MSDGLHSTAELPQLGRQEWAERDYAVLGGLATIAAAAIGLGFAGLSRVQPVAGLALLLALAYCFSSAVARSTTAPWRGG